MIRQRYREEFEQLGVDDLRKRLAAGMYDEDKRKAARLWIDEMEHGEDRAHKAEILKLQRASGARATIALVISVIALWISAGGLALAVWLASHGAASYPAMTKPQVLPISGTTPPK